MANEKKVFTDESLKTLIDEIKSYTDNAAAQNLKFKLSLGRMMTNGYIFRWFEEKVNRKQLDI